MNIQMNELHGINTHDMNTKTHHYGALSKQGTKLWRSFKRKPNCVAAGY
jgi:hypothetical protein